MTVSEKWDWQDLVSYFDWRLIIDCVCWEMVIFIANCFRRRTEMGRHRISLSVSRVCTQTHISPGLSPSYTDHYIFTTIFKFKSYTHKGSRITFSSPSPLFFLFLTSLVNNNDDGQLFLFLCVQLSLSRKRRRMNRLTARGFFFLLEQSSYDEEIFFYFFTYLDKIRSH